jgi:hypothetical protein
MKLEGQTIYHFSKLTKVKNFLAVFFLKTRKSKSELSHDLILIVHRVHVVGGNINKSNTSMA